MIRALLTGALILLAGLPATGQSDPVDWEQIHRLVRTGRYEQAEKLLTGRLEPAALRWRIELAERRGARSEAQDLAGQALLGYRSGWAGFSPADAAATAAYAAWQLDRWHQSNQIYLEAAESPDASPSMYVDWGYLYLQKYEAGEAESIFLDAAGLDRPFKPWDRWGKADIHLGLARALQSQGRPEAEEALKKAEEVQPDHPELLALKAELEIRESDWDESAALIDRGLKTNPNYLPLLRLKAARFFFLNQEQPYRKSKARVLEINPVDADLPELLGDLCVIRRRLREAIEFFRTAVERNPRQWSALSSLGINLLRIGEEAEGKAVLEEAYANDPFNIWTVNTLRLLDSFDRFTRFSTPHFEVKIETDEVAGLRPYVEPLLERSLQTISEKYGHSVQGPYIFEMYSDHDDFAVRTLGLPGLGALGATFGKVVAMDSPSARPGGRFHWGATLWHEVAHVVTLSLSRQKVPRWLTEGISMWEERQSSPGWGDPLSIPFVRAYSDGKLLSVPELNSGFERPRFPGQLEISYYQAGWICEFIERNYGVDKLRAMLEAFGEGLTQEEVFQKVLGLSEEEFDRRFQAEMKTVLEPLTKTLEAVEVAEMPGGELQLAAHFGLATEHPDNYLANLYLGRRLIQEENADEAVIYLEKARRLFPQATGENSPYPLLRELYRKNGRDEELLALLESWWEIAPRYADVGRELADRLIGRGRGADAVPVLEGLMYLDPLEADTHRRLGDLYLEAGRAEEAAAELRVALDLNSTDPAGVHYRLARALAAQGKETAARREVLLALEIAPSYSEAQKLLLKLVRP